MLKLSLYPNISSFIHISYIYIDMKCTCDVIKIKMFLVMSCFVSCKTSILHIDYFDSIDPQKMSYEYVNIFYKE